MILADATIRSLLADGSICIEPNVVESDIRPVGIRLHLGDELLIPTPGQTVDLAGNDDIDYERVMINEDGYVLEPGAFVLGSTREQIGLSNELVGKLDGRSTFARLGLLIHCSSDTVDGNHDHPRSIVLEMKNLGNFRLKLKAGVPIAMIVFHQLVGTIEQSSQTQYQHQTGVQPPNLVNRLIQ